MTEEQTYQHVRGKQIFHDKAIDAGSSTAYSRVFSAPQSTVWNTHHIWTDGAANFTATYTLWASDYESPDETNDDEWVQMTSNHGYDGLPGGNPVGGSGKDMVDISASGALHYRWKVEWISGSAVLQSISVQKVFGKGNS